MSRPRRNLLTTVSQPLGRVQPHGVQHAVAPFLGLQRDERFLDEVGEQIDDFVGRYRAAGTYGLGGFQGPSAREDRQSLEQRMFVRRQHVV